MNTPLVAAIDYKTGLVRWAHPYPGPGGGIFSLLTTAGGLLFSGDPSRNFIAFDPANGKPLWHVRLAATVSNGPITYMLDGRQYVLVAAGDELYALTLPSHGTGSNAGTERNEPLVRVRKVSPP
jgi:alcohol dehydrogenase (cytochrome c)